MWFRWSWRWFRDSSKINGKAIAETTKKKPPPGPPEPPPGPPTPLLYQSPLGVYPPGDSSPPNDAIQQNRRKTKRNKAAEIVR